MYTKYWLTCPRKSVVTCRPPYTIAVDLGRKATQKQTKIFFEVGIPNLVCGCILGWQSVAYHIWITVTLTSNLVFRIIMFGAFSILFALGIPNLVCGCIFGWQSVMYQFCDLDLISRIVVSGAYLIYCFKEESPIYCMDTSLDADVSYTISGHYDLDL